jgi:hypothetical protein
MKSLIVVLVLISSQNAFASTKYMWNADNQSGISCFGFKVVNGKLTNEAVHVNGSICEKSDPTVVDWAPSQGGDTLCYQYTSDGRTMNGYLPVNDSFCEKAHPTKFIKSASGKCFQYTHDGRMLNEGTAVAPELCVK